MIADSAVTIEWPPSVFTLATVRVAVSRSPATIGRLEVNRWSPCTTREKSMPASGSASSCASVRSCMMTAKVGGATTSSYPAAFAASGSRLIGLVAKTARANSRTFSRPTR